MSHIWPTTGPAHGSTVVTVYGAFYRNDAELFCRFGTHTQTRGQFVTTTHVLCTSPLETGAATMAVEVSMNNQDFTASAVMFGYQGTLVVNLVV